MLTQNRNILILDDDLDFAKSLAAYLNDHNFVCYAVNTVENAKLSLQVRRFSVLISDIRLGKNEKGDEINGTTLINQFRKASIEKLYVILITGYSSVPNAISAVRQRAFDYFEKPLDLEKLISVLERIFSKINKKTDIVDTLKMLQQRVDETIES